MEQKETGIIIKELRLRSGLSQEKLAEVSGLSLRSIQRIENNNTIPRGDSLKRIAEALKVSIEELTGPLLLKNMISVIPLKEIPKTPLILILIRLQLVCFAILILVYVYLFTKKFFEVNLPLPDNPKPAIMFLWLLNIVNAFVLLFIVVIKWTKTPKAI